MYNSERLFNDKWRKRTAFGLLCSQPPLPEEFGKSGETSGGGLEKFRGEGRRAEIFSSTGLRFICARAVVGLTGEK